MAKRVVKIASIIQNQLPEFIRDEFPLVQEFLKSYYKSVELPGGPVDIIQNIDQYVKIDHILPIQDETILTQDVSFFDDTINVETTYGFPDSYGLLKINDEIISYTRKTSTSFEGCVRGFSGVTSLTKPSSNDELVFESSNSSEHVSSSTVKNLSILFLKEFLVKIKKQVTPGFEERDFYPDVNQRLFIKQSKDFYKSKGTDSSFKILFYALFGTPVEVIKPREYLIQPSDAQYRITKDIVAELVSGNPEELVNGTLYQDADEFFPGARGTITHVEYFTRNAKDYYLIKLDYDYNKDIDVAGSVKSEFKINPKTIVTSSIPSGSSYVDVDSTVGFPEAGVVIVELDNGTQLTISYQSKTFNQFFECTGITQDIPEGKEIKLNKYVYGFSSKNRQEQVRLRITGVLSGLSVIDTPYLYNKDDTIKIKTLGNDVKGLQANNWFFNVPVRYDVAKVEVVDLTDFTYKATLYDNHSFVIGDSLTLISSFGEEYFGRIVFVESVNVVALRLSQTIDNALSYRIKKNISKVNILNYPELNFYNSNVQNVYDDLNGSLYVTSPSLPSYLGQPLQIDDQSVVFSGTINGTDLVFKDSTGLLLTHSFFTGDSVVYKPTTADTQITTSGVYFIKRVNENTVRLARSREDLYNEQYVTLNGSAANDRLELFDFNDSSLNLQEISPQGLIRKLTEPVAADGDYETSPGPIGIFVNGVELLNYKSKNQLFYGPIEEIIVGSSGQGYNVVEPPNLIVTDDSGSGCIAYCSVTGNLEKINIIDAGFDYLDTPAVTIKGGTGSGAKARVNLVSFDHQESFNALTGVNPATDTIEFLDYHKFRDYEEVVYSADGNPVIPGLVSNATYFISVQDPYKIRLHKSLSDAVVGINTINITSSSNGLHVFKAKVKKKKISSIEVENKGTSYKNHKTVASSVGINTATDIITISNHRYNSGEIIRYSTSGVSVGGLSTTGSYYVTTLNENQFKLSPVASGDLNPDFYYRTQQFVNLTSTGSGNHYFNYEPIVVQVEGRIGVSSVGSKNLGAVVQPVFRGEIDSVYIENGGSNYGSNEVLNFNKQPSFTINSGFGAQLKPIIVDGRVVDVVIQSSGSNYESIPDLVVNGTGRGCVLTPVLSNGTIADVKVISSGFGYENNASIDVIPYGTEAKFEARIRSWRINLVERNINTNKVNLDDGVLYSGISQDFGLQYTHLYAARPLRASVLATKFDGGRTFFVKDLQLLNGQEITTNAHSPIIGWAYDGNPIYGPYGFSGPSGGAIRILKSGYSLKSNNTLSQENRPSLSQYPAGSFIEDYEYTGTGDLDEYNGRFCVTPEFPNGVYAYFSTINTESLETGGPFKGYRKPVFPYVVGNHFKSQPIEYNFNPKSNQSNVDLNVLGWVRNTTPYNLLESRSGYDYIINPNEDREQVTDIKSTLTGSIENIIVTEPGENYKVGDKVNFTNENTGRNVKAQVGTLNGVEVKSIKVEQFEIIDVPLIAYNSLLGIKTETSYLRNGDLVKIITPFEYNQEAVIKIKPTVVLNLSVGVASTTTTGIITSFKVSGPLNSDVYENDLYEIGNEVVKILNVDARSSSILVQRNVENYVGITSYTAGTFLKERANKFISNLGINTTYNLSRDKEFYFDTENVVAIGTTFGVGISSTLFKTINNFSSRVSIGTGSTTTLYFDRINERSRYSFGDFVRLKDSTDNDFDVEKTKVVGVGNTFIVVDYDSSSLSVGSGVTSFVDSWEVDVIPTRTVKIQNHGLSLNDKIQYTPPEGGTPISVVDPNNPTITYNLPDDQDFYVLPVNENLIGISTEPIKNDIDISSTNLLMFADSGTNNLESGDIHSFKVAQENTLRAKIIKNLVTVETETPHNLSLNDYVDVDCKSGISTSLKVKYNDTNRRIVIGEYSFVGGDVDSVSDTIRIEDHKFRSGEKVIYESTTPSGGLENQGLYYIFVVDENTIKFSRTLYDVSRKNFVDITSASSGKLLKVNPLIQVTKYNKIRFDLSDPSLSFKRSSITYPAFEFAVYTDKKFKNKFVSTQTTNKFEVKNIGIVGVTNDAALEIAFNENVPEVLYYKLTPIDYKNNSAVKLECIIDEEQYEHNKIELVESKYSGRHRVIDTDPNPFTFKYTILDYPEKAEYSQSEASLSYFTDSKTALGPVHSVRILSGGKGYSNLPFITGVASTSGSGCVLEPQSESIGRFKSYEIQDVGFDYSVDYTVRPKAKLPEIIKVEPLSILENVEVSFVGKNYTESPNLIVLDGVTKEPLREVQLDYDIQNRTVEIIVNANGFNNVDPIIIPINNTNGYEIKSISFDSDSRDVTLELETGFSDPEDFPFTVGGKILVENVQVSPTQKGYNSENYDYTLFTITSLDANIGGIGATISYNLGSTGEPGVYDDSIVKGIVVPESHFPRFNVKLTKRSFSKQETVISNDSIGIVESWDENNEILKISTNKDFEVGNIIAGQASGTRAIIKEVTSFDAYYDIKASSIVKSGWKTQTGFLNNELQRLHDSDYYQYFSYSLKSKVSFNEWEESVKSLNHTAGFKKFSDLVLESAPTASGISTEQNLGTFTGIADFYSVVNTNCVTDFDLVRENNIVFGDNLKSNEIYFESRVLQDYIESFGNRVLMIDDISPQFNSNPRPTKFSIVDTFALSESPYRKYFIHCINKRFSNKSESTIVSLLHDGTNGFLNQYAKLSTEDLLGNFDFTIFGSTGALLFYPIKFEVDNYDLEIFSFNIDDALDGVEQLNLGDVSRIQEYTQSINAGQTNTTNIISVGSSFRALKALIQLSSVDGSYYEINELNIIHDGNDSYVTEYGQLNTDGISGFGTFDSYVSGGNLIVDITPNVGYAQTIVANSLVVLISDENSSGVGTTTLNNNIIQSASVSIAASTSPSPNTIFTYPDTYSSSYLIITVADITNNEYQLSEFIALNNIVNNEVYYTEYGSIETQSKLGLISAGISGNNVEVYFTPNSGIDCEVRLFELSQGKTDDNLVVNLGNSSISVGYGFYTGTKNDIKKSFALTHNQKPIFERTFSAEDSSIVNLETNTIRIPENYFVTGEKIKYVYSGNESPIGIGTTSIIGVGTTDKLPEELYVIKLNDLDIQVAAAASLALSSKPIPLDLTQLGIGTAHKFIANKQNTKCLITIDNIIQSPIAFSKISTILSSDVGLFDSQIYLNSIDSFYGGDMIQVNQEIMRIVSVGVGASNVVVVDREIMGTGLSTHISGQSVTKVSGNYNIVDNTIHFSEAPYGQIPILNPSGRSDELDYSGLSIRSTFSGRAFLRSGLPDTNLESYSYNYVFDDISDEFDGFDTNFNLKSGGQDIVGISTGNAVVLINSIFQLPERNDGAVPIEGNYNLTLGSNSIVDIYDFGRVVDPVTTIYDLGSVVGVITDRYDLGELASSVILDFIGNPVESTYDVNTTNLPRGGIIASIGSTEGFGYQPLVAAGGTAIVSSSGTIESISIGNSGSGYRVGIQTFVQVGVQTESLGTPKIEYVGIASVSNGHVVGVTITNPGFGYTFTNPPTVIFDDPLSYSNIPLIYSNPVSEPGVGAVVDVVVGQGSSVISFELKNNGFAYKRGDVLTIGYGGTTGIPLDSSLPFREFQITVTETINDSFSGWNFGDLQVLDPIDDLFDGRRKSFPIRLNGLPTTIRSRIGSNIDIQATLLVFINDVLQVPGESYVFNGGSIITFNEAPKGPIEGLDGTGDTSKILFYRGTAEIDTIDVDVLESVKVGDKLTINSEDRFYQQSERTVEQIKSTDIVGTNLYSKFGVSEDETFTRPVTWCRQTEDIFINGETITKDREIYEPLIQPSTNIISNVTSASTEIFVESVKTFFDNSRESLTLYDKIILTTQDSLVSAAATALVSIAGTISSIVLNNGGLGYSTNPSISIGGDSATASASVTNGIVTNVNVINPGIGYTFTNPPQVLIESPTLKYEVIDDVLYDGDFGKIVAINTTSVGVASTGLVLDFLVPPDSFLRDLNVNTVGLSTTGISGIQTGYYFTLRNTNIGSGVTALDSSGNVIGIGTSYLDGIYQAVAVSIGTTVAPGIGSTAVTKVTVSLSSYNGLTDTGFGEFYGDFSWGRIYSLSRKNPQDFDSYINGLVGIETSPVVQRYNPLKYRGYIN